jgi:hypothetical protein
VAGSYIAWAAGRYGGQPALQRWGHRLWLREHDLDRASTWFARARPAGRPDRPRPAGGAHLHLTSRRHRGRGPRAVRDLHNHRLHPLNAALAYAGYAVGANWQSIVNGLRGPTHITELGWAEPLWPKTSPGDTGEGLAREAVGR